MRKHTKGGGWDCLWCGFHKITSNHKSSLSRVAKFKILESNVSLCVAKIPYSRLARY